MFTNSSPNSAFAGQIQLRYILRVSDTVFTVQNANFQNFGASTASGTQNNILVPLKIYGIK